ncbi:MAG TPA: capsule assembly Wzi family protein [Gemmatimonadaceae bacterium]|nr:capsule assembly Wzi family protein [Gemmatimonadaceae bacterium]
MLVRYWLLAVALVAAAPLRAQTPRDFASAFVPADHWSLTAVRRAVALGLSSRRHGWDDGSLTRRAVVLLLTEAADSAAARTHPGAAMLRGYVHRLEAEFGATAARLKGAPRRGGGEGSFALGVGGRSGVVGTASSDWRANGGSGPAALPNVLEPAGAVSWTTELAPHVAAAVAPRRADGRWDRSEAYALASWRAVTLWGGRRALRYGGAESGGILVNPVAAFNAGGLAVAPTALPGVLRYLGPVRLEATLGQLDSSNAIRHPWLMLLHGSFSPHPRLLIAGNIASMMSGSGRPPLTLGNVFEVLAFARARRRTGGVEFENSIVSGEVRYRVPAPVPVLAYVEWGSEDNRGAWWTIPGAVGGLEVAAVPALPRLAVGAEYTRFGPPCFCDVGLESNWYRHYVYTGGWAVDPTPLGHPLGGNGVEVTLFARYDSDDARLRLNGRVFHRERDYYNLFAPDREGDSVGGVIRASWRARARLDLEVDGSLEEGAGDWRQVTLFAGARLMF